MSEAQIEQLEVTEEQDQEDLLLLEQKYANEIKQDDDNEPSSLSKAAQLHLESICNEEFQLKKATRCEVVIGSDRTVKEMYIDGVRGSIDGLDDPVNPFRVLLDSQMQVYAESKSAAVIETNNLNSFGEQRISFSLLQFGSVDKNEERGDEGTINDIELADNESAAANPEENKIEEQEALESNSWMDKWFGAQPVRERAVGFIPVAQNVIRQGEDVREITTLFPPSITTMSPQVTKVMPTENIFHEVAAAPVGTEVVIPGELVPDEFEGANQVIRDAMVVKRLDTGVSISFVEGVVNNPSPPFLVQSPPRLWPASQPLPSVAAKAMAVESLRPAAIEVSSPVQIETVKAATPNQVEENGHILNPTWQPDIQRGIENKQPLPAVDGLPIVTYRVDTMFSNSTKLAIDQNVSHNPSSPPLIRGGNLTLPSTPNSSPPSLWSEPQSPAEKMPINVLENVTDRAPEDVPVQPTAAKQTPGVGFVRMVETRSAQFVDTPSLKTNDPVLPKSMADSPVVFDQAPPQLERTDYLVESSVIVSDIHESTTVRIQGEASTRVQHEPTFQLAREDNHDTPVVVKETIVSDRRESVEAAREAAPAPNTSLPPKRVGAEPVYLFAPLIASAPNKPRHVIRIEATNTDEAEQPLSVTPDTRPELISEIRRRVGSPGSRGNRATQIIAPPPARATTQASV